MTPDEIAEAIKEHNRLNPTHGVACVCMDEFVYLLRDQLKAFDTPIDMWISSNPQTVNLARRYSHVLALTLKSLN